MDATGVLRIMLYAVLIVLACAAAWGVFEIVGMARAVRRLSEDLDGTAPELARRAGGTLERANATLEALNSELVRMNGVVTSLEEVSDRVNSTTRAVEEIVEVPAAAMSGLADGVRRFFSVLTGRRL
jgi:methyl-accepting chemotaxis protein